MNNRKADQKTIIKNWNLLVEECKELNLAPLDEKGFCNGDSKAFLLYQHSNRGDEFSFFRNFLHQLSENDIKKLAALIKKYLANKQGFFKISLGNNSVYSFQKLIDFILAINVAQTTQEKTKFKGSIAAHWDSSYMIACYPNQLAEYLKKCNVMKGNKLKFINTMDHAMASAKNDKLEKGKKAVFFDTNTQQTAYKNEEELAQALLTSLKKYPIINIVVDEISYGNENREFDDLLLKYEASINQDFYMKELMMRYFKGNISRRDTAYGLYGRLQEMKDQTTLTLQKELNNYLKQHPDYSQISTETAILNNAKSSPLIFACSKNCLGLVNKLLSEGADPNVLNTDGNTALIAVADDEHVEIVKRLLDAGADPNVKNNGWTALLFAVDENHTEVLKVLAQKADLNIAYAEGFTALMMASNKGFVEIAKILVDAGADVNALNVDGWAVIMMAASDGNIGMVNVLLSAKNIDLDVEKNGWTALLFAADAGHTEVVKALINAGADINATTNNGLTALKLAEDNNNDGIVDLIKQHQQALASKNMRTI